MLQHVPNFPDPGSREHKTYPIYFYFQKGYKLNAQFQNPMGRSYVEPLPSGLCCCCRDVIFKFVWKANFITHHSPSTMKVIKMKVYLGNYI